MCFGDYMMFKGTNTYNLNSCETIEVFYNLRTDLDKLKYATHITKIILDVTNENENCYKILQLFLNTLYTISELDKDLEFVLAIFKIRLLCILGFTPNIQMCTNCRKNENILYFSFRDNGFKCGACGKQDKGVFQISNTTQDAIKYIVMAPPKKIFSFNIPSEAQKELAIIAKLYLNEKLEKTYKMEF